MAKTDFVDESIEVPDDVPMAPSNEYMANGDAGDSFDQKVQDEIPEGTYYAIFDKGLREGQPGSGDYRFSFDFRITAGDMRNKTQRAWVTLEKDGVKKNVNWKLDEIMAALNAPRDPASGNWRGNFSQLEGRPVILEIRHYEGRAQVGKVIAPDDLAVQAARNFV